MSEQKRMIKYVLPSGVNEMKDRQTFAEMCIANQMIKNTSYITCINY